MPQEHLEAGEVDEAEEVLDVVFPSGLADYFDFFADFLC
jgi:hypothetical protein